MEYTVFVIDGGYLDESSDTIMIQGVKDHELRLPDKTALMWWFALV